MMYKNYFILLWLLLMCPAVNGQQKRVPVPDSLKGKDYLYFIEKLESDELDESASGLYSNAYLEKAKAEKNWKEMMNAYKSILHQSGRYKRMVYADSMIIAAKHTNEDELIGSAYLTKGIVYYDLKDHNNALDNYLIAHEYIAGTDDDYLKYKVRYNIAQIKYYLGFYDEAVSLFTDCVKYFKGKEDMPYLSSLHSLGLCYNRLGKLDLCTKANDLGIKEAARLQYYEAIPRFIHSEGINQHFLKNYNVSIAKLEETLPSLRKSKDFANETVSYFYIGKNLWELNRREKAIPFFIKVDRAFREENYMRPDLRETYELLIDYYKEKNDLQNQLIYINQLLLAEKFVSENYKYLSGRIDREYDTKELLQAKTAIEKALHLRTKLIVLFIAVILVLLASVCYLLRKAALNKRKFKELMSRGSQPKEGPSRKLSADGTLNINPDVIASVLKHMEKFERTEKYLAKEMTLPKMAHLFDSNIVYVSKIIQHYKNKKSPDYVNDLKIDYIVRRLKAESKFRNYTNKALGDEAGFSTTQHFTRAFIKNTGIAPTYFVQELKKELNKEKI